jgi:Mn2+/Fe2+ NRAMP family transporter
LKKFLAIALGILTAIGGFVDIGDIVANAEAGARFGIAHAWVLLVGVIGICAYAEMAGRVTAVWIRWSLSQVSSGGSCSSARG